MPDNMPQVSQLEELDVKSVGLVGKAANKRKFVLFKSRDKEKEMPEEIKKDEPTEEVAVEPTVPAVDAVSFKDWATDIVQSILGKSKVEPEVKPEVEPEPVVAAPDLDTILKAQADMAVRLEKAEADLVEAQEDAAAEKAIRKSSEYLTKAQGLAIPGKVEELAELMAKADAAGLGEQLGAVLDAASATIVQSGIFVEKGTQAEPADGSDFEGRVKARAAELRAADTKLTEHEAIAKAFRDIGRSDPDLANAHVEQRQIETAGRK